MPCGKAFSLGCYSGKVAGSDIASMFDKLVSSQGGKTTLSDNLPAAKQLGVYARNSHWYGKSWARSREVSLR